MTMLDRMRRHQNWLKWSLALVCLAFVLFYIPDFLGRGTTTDAASSDTVARVNGHEIRADEFRRIRRDTCDGYLRFRGRYWVGRWYWVRRYGWRRHAPNHR